MEIKRVQPSFGNMIISPKAQIFIKKLPYDRQKYIEKMKTNSNDNPIVIFVSTFGKEGGEKLYVEVGHKTFTTNIFAGVVSTIKKGVALANKLHAEQLHQQALTNGMIRPTL